MSIPNYLRGEVRFLDWKPVEPGTYRFAYTHGLKAWKQIWGYEGVPINVPPYLEDYFFNR